MPTPIERTAELVAQRARTAPMTTGELLALISTVHAELGKPEKDPADASAAAGRPARKSRTARRRGAPKRRRQDDEPPVLALGPALGR